MTGIPLVLRTPTIFRTSLNEWQRLFRKIGGATRVSQRTEEFSRPPTAYRLPLRDSNQLFAHRANVFDTEGGELIGITDQQRQAPKDTKTIMLPTGAGTHFEKMHTSLTRTF